MGYTPAVCGRPSRPGAFISMSTPHSGRSRGFWLGGFLFLFLIHAFAIFVYGEREKALPPRQPIKPFLHCRIRKVSPAARG